MLATPTPPYPPKKNSLSHSPPSPPPPLSLSLSLRLDKFTSNSLAIHSQWEDKPGVAGVYGAREVWIMNGRGVLGNTNEQEKCVSVYTVFPLPQVRELETGLDCC